VLRCALCGVEGHNKRNCPNHGHLFSRSLCRSLSESSASSAASTSRGPADPTAALIAASFEADLAAPNHDDAHTQPSRHLRRRGAAGLERCRSPPPARGMGGASIGGQDLSAWEAGFLGGGGGARDATLCHAMLCCAMLCYAMQCYDMLCYVADALLLPAGGAAGEREMSAGASAKVASIA
jgi:hypothetical protein